MGISFIQTDGVTVCGTTNLNSGLPASANPSDRLAVEGGTPGVTPDIFRCRNANFIGIIFEFAPGVAEWGDSEDYVCPVNVSGVAGGTATISAAYVTRVPVGCSGGSLVSSVTGLSLSVNSLGVKTVTIPAVASSGLATDKCRIEIATTTGGTPLNPTLTPNQTITTPIVAPVTDPGDEPARWRHQNFIALGVGYV